MRRLLAATALAVSGCGECEPCLPLTRVSVAEAVDEGTWRVDLEAGEIAGTCEIGGP